MCDRVDAHVTQLLLQPCIPMVLDVVVGAPWHLGSYERPSAAKRGMELDNEVFFIRSEASMADVRAQVVSPA